MSYNGWTNYETWLVKLWIDNDQGEQEYWLEQAEGADKDTFPQIINDYFKGAAPDLQGFWADLLNAALSEVNWYEIAESLREDAKELAS